MYRSSVTACIPSFDVHGGIALKHGRVFHQKVQRAATLLAIEHDDDISGLSRSPRSVIDKENLSVPGFHLGCDLRSDPGPDNQVVVGQSHSQHQQNDDREHDRYPPLQHLPTLQPALSGTVCNPVSSTGHARVSWLWSRLWPMRWKL